MGVGASGEYCTLSICGLALHGGNVSVVLYDGDTRLQLLVFIHSNDDSNTNMK